MAVGLSIFKGQADCQPWPDRESDADPPAQPQSLRIAKQDARINRLEEAVELWRERAGGRIAANDED